MSIIAVKAFVLRELDRRFILSFDNVMLLTGAAERDRKERSRERGRDEERVRRRSREQDRLRERDRGREYGRERERDRDRSSRYRN